MRHGCIAAVVACLALAGCGVINSLTSGFSSGLGAEQVTTDIIVIKSSPRFSTEDVLLKAAQTTKTAGSTHFKLISADAVGRPLDVANPAAPPPSTAAGSPAVIRPGQDTYIRVLRLDPGQEAPSGY